MHCTHRYVRSSTRTVGFASKTPHQIEQSVPSFIHSFIPALIYSFFVVSTTGFAEPGARRALLVLPTGAVNGERHDIPRQSNDARHEADPTNGRAVVVLHGLTPVGARLRT